MDLFISFRKQDSFVEVDGTRKPLSAFPDLKVLRHDREIPGLLEVDLRSGWITVEPPAEYQRWMANPATPEGSEWQETISNLSIEGIPGQASILVTGIDMRLRARPRPRKASPKPLMSSDAAAEERRGIIEGLSARKAPSAPASDDWLDMLESLK